MWSEDTDRFRVDYSFKNLVCEQWFACKCLKTSVKVWRGDLIWTIWQFPSCKWLQCSRAISIYPCDIIESRVGKRCSGLALRSHTGVAESSTQINYAKYLVSRRGYKVWRARREGKANTICRKWREKQWNFLKRRNQVKNRWKDETSREKGKKKNLLRSLTKGLRLDANRETFLSTETELVVLKREIIVSNSFEKWDARLFG